MESKFEINYQNPIGDIDDYLDEELTPFQFALEELRRYVDPEFYIKLNDKYSVHFYIYADITTSYEEIVKSVKRMKSAWTGKDDIWFCEQGADFYFFYEVKNDAVELEYKKGPNVGTYNGKIPDLRLVVSKSEYVQIWEALFKDLALLIEEELDKKISLPFNSIYRL